MNKKGFTLIELLAVILILAIIAAILSPIVSKIIESAREQSARRSAERYVGAAQEFYVESQMDISKADALGTNLIDKLELQNEDGVGYITAYPDGTTEMAIVISNICFTKTTTQDPKDIESSTDISNCKVNSTNVRISSIDSKDNSIDINVDNSNDTSVTMTSCKFGTSRTDISTDGTISGNKCTLSPTVSGTRYYYEITFSDGSKRNGSVQGGSGSTTFNQGGSGYAGGGDHGGGAGGSGSYGSVAGPIFEGENGQVYYTGTYLSSVQTKYFNVTTGQKCRGSEWQNNSSATSGCLRFYAYLEDSLSYTMILDRNFSNINQYGNNVGFAWATSGYNGAGPVTAYAKLKEYTNSWQGTVTPKNYVYVLGANPYFIEYEDDGAKARFITTDEIAHITGNSSFNPRTTGADGWFYLDGGTSASTGQTWQTQIATSTEKSAYYWLFDYSHSCANYGCNNNLGGNNPAGISGYWTSDAISGTSNYAWIVGANGALDYCVGGMNGTTYYNNSSASYGGQIESAAGISYLGIRPVITVLKSTLN